jgi:NADH-quinone oxidoreductase subunit M
MLLSLIFSTLLCGIITLFFIDSKNLFLLRTVSLSTSSIVLIFSSIILMNFDSNSYFFQYYVTYKLGSDIMNMIYSFGIDNISIFFFVLSSLLVFSCILFIWNDKHFKEYAINLLIIELFLLIIFSVLDLFLFYIFFEAILIPMYLLIGI